MAKKSSEGSSSAFKSSLKSGTERFLSRVVVHALEDGWKTPEDFLRHFGPLDLMRALEAAPELRKNILVIAAGVHEKIARKKSTESAAEDLQIALEEDLTTPADLLSLFQADDRVRYLEADRLWSFAFEGDFHKANGTERDRAVERMAFLIETAMEEELLTTQDIGDGVGFSTIAERLPVRELQRVLEHALDLGRQGASLTEATLMDVVPLRSLLGYLPLDLVWEKVIVHRVAEPARFTSSGGRRPPPARPAPAPGSGSDSSASSAVGMQSAATSQASSSTLSSNVIVDDTAFGDLDDEISVSDAMESAPRREGPPPKPASVPAPAAGPEESTDPGLDAGTVVDADILEPAATDDEGEARKKVIEGLTAINRLPPRHAELSTSILLSIESMYAELLTASTDEAREECIRDSFPNQQHLTTALLALIELLDPSIDTNDPVIRDADVDSLIKVVLFEERTRYEQAHGDGAGSFSNGSRSVPPPLPKAAPPPLPAEKAR
ncbi:MAG: hypothetical protein DIU78_001160 [Pseudomonadota bacterium]|nr:MAG: hypothetical protein DIU78_22665 [Pseudomonadota bacterium]